MLKCSTEKMRTARLNDHPLWICHYDGPFHISGIADIKKRLKCTTQEKIIKRFQLFVTDFFHDKILHTHDQLTPLIFNSSVLVSVIHSIEPQEAHWCTSSHRQIMTVLLNDILCRFLVLEFLLLEGKIQSFISIFQEQSMHAPFFKSGVN